MKATVGQAQALVRIVLAIIVVIVAGFWGLVSLFADYPPHWAYPTWVLYVLSGHALAGFVVGMLLPLRWRLSIATAWGAILLSVVGLAGMLRLRTTMSRASRFFLIALLGACAAPREDTTLPHTLPDSVMRRPFVLWATGRPVPSEGYDRDPAMPYDSTDLVIQPAEMRPFYGPPGEFGYYIDGLNYGFKALSFILTETHPNGGPDLHSHDIEEAHILYEGKVMYLIGNRRFIVEGPYITRVPAGVPHTFMNVGMRPLHLTGVFPDAKPVYRHIGPNPLVADSSTVRSGARPAPRRK